MKAITPSLPSPAPTRSERSVDSAAADEAFGAVIAAALGVAPAPGSQYRAPQDSADKDRHYAAAVGPARHTAAGAGVDRADGDRPVGSDGAGTGAGGAAAAVTAPDDSARPGAATTTAADSNPKAASTAGVNGAATPAATPAASGAPAPSATAGTAPRTGAAPGSALDAAAAALAKALGAAGTGVNVNGTPGTATVTVPSPATGTVDTPAIAQQPALTTVANPAVAQGVLPPQLAGLAAATNPLPTADGGTKKASVPGAVSLPAVTPASTDAADKAPSSATPPIAPGQPPVAPDFLPSTAAATATPMVATVVAAAVSDTTKGSKSGSSKGDGLDAGVDGNTGATPDASLAPGAVTSFDAAMQTAAPLVPPTATAAAQNMSAAFVGGGVPDQIVQVLAPLRSAKDGDYTLSLQLHPAELGPVTVHVEVHQGVLSVHLVADQAQGHDALHGSLADLRTQLQASGVRTGDIGVGTPGSALSQQGNGGQPRHQPHSGQPGYDGAGRRPAHHDGGSTVGGRGGDRSGDRNAATQRQPVGVSADSALDVRI
jgi:flagellar hook-length control protein FliK